MGSFYVIGLPINFLPDRLVLVSKILVARTSPPSACAAPAVRLRFVTLSA